MGTLDSPAAFVPWSRILAVAALLLAAFAGTASAATRHVSPTGVSVTGCSEALPCGIVAGIETASDGDVVVIAPGTYGSVASPVDTDLEFPAGVSITVRGAVIGPARPVINVGTIFRVRGAGSLLTDVEVVNDAFVLEIETGTRADRVIARQPNIPGTPGNACSLEGSAVITNSLCIRSGALASNAVAMTGTGAARNVTGISSGLGISSIAGFSGTVANSIGRSVTLDLNPDPPAVFTHVYGETVAPAPPDVTIPGLVTSGLLFRSGTDFRQQPTSTTVNAGSAAQSLGDLDLNGNLRTVGPAPDIGAYEEVPAPTAAPGVAVPENTTATVTPQVVTGGGRTTLTLEYGTTPGGPYPLSVSQVVDASATPSAPAVALTGLTPSTTYVYRATVSSDGGAASSTEGSFTTVGPPTAAVDSVSAVTQTAATLNGTVNTFGGAGTAHFEFAVSPGGAPLLTPDQALAAATGPRAVSAPLAGLTPLTAYSAVLVVTTSAGTVRSPAAGFTTLAQPPVASLGTGVATGPDAAVLIATVDTQGIGGTGRFELTPTDGGAQVVTPAETLAPAAGPRQVRITVGGLRPSTTYAVRVVLVTAIGTSAADAGTFTTQAAPTGPTGPTGPPTTTDRTPPTVQIRSLTPFRFARRTTITPRVVCNEQCTVRVVARLGVRQGRPLRFRVLAGARVVLRLTPVRSTPAADTDVRVDLARARRAVLAALGARRPLVVRLQITATDRSGNRRTVTRFVVVRPR